MKKIYSYLFTITLIFFFFLILFIYLFLAVLGLRFCVRAFPSCGERGPLFITVHWPLTVASSPVVEHRLSRCGSRAQLLRGTWDPPGPGLEPVSPALAGRLSTMAGRLSTTAPPGKPLLWFLCYLKPRALPDDITLVKIAEKIQSQRWNSIWQFLVMSSWN